MQKSKEKEQHKRFLLIHPDYYKEYRKKYYLIPENRRKRKERQKRWRHRIGISKRYNSELRISYTKEYRRLQAQKQEASKEGGGELTVKTIQSVYENNIKKYGILTCYLCLKPILFGKDHLEHKIPLIRGGSNIKENLEIACERCNRKKGTKTEIEFKNSRKINLWECE